MVSGMANARVGGSRAAASPSFPPPVLRGRVREGVAASDHRSPEPPPPPSPGVPEEGVRERRARAWATGVALLLALASPLAAQEKKGGKTAAAEAEYYKLIEIPVPENITLEVGALECMPDGRLAV